MTAPDPAVLAQVAARYAEAVQEESAASAQLQEASAALAAAEHAHAKAQVKSRGTRGELLTYSARGVSS